MMTRKGHGYDTRTDLHPHRPRVYIPDERGQHWGDWGRVIGYDGEFYHIAFADDENDTRIFTRSEIRVKR